MTCPACTTAATNRLCGLYRAQCEGCTARHIANGMAFWESRKFKRMTKDYKARLVAAFGADGWRAGHDAVLAEFKRMEGLKNG